jgi:hypothetical protein
MERLQDYIDKKRDRTENQKAGVRAGAGAEAADAAKEIWCRGDPVLAQAAERELMPIWAGKNAGASNMLAEVRPWGGEETMRGREDGRSRLLKMVMVQCTWRAAVLMVQRQEDQDDGEHGACTGICYLHQAPIVIALRLYADIVRQEPGRSMLIIEIVLGESRQLVCSYLWTSSLELPSLPQRCFSLIRACLLLYLDKVLGQKLLIIASSVSASISRDESVRRSESSKRGRTFDIG